MNLVKILLVTLLAVPLFAKHAIDINVLSEDAKKTDKVIMVFFHMTKCPYCKRMLKEMYEGQEAMATINKDFYYVDITTDKDETVVFQDFKGTSKEFADYFGIKLYPTILFLMDNKIVYYVHGYKNKKTFQYILKYVASRQCKKVDFLEFLDDMVMEEE
jgi:thioredoxin-related protein